MGVCGQSTQTGLVLASGVGEMDRRAGNTMKNQVSQLSLLYLFDLLLNSMFSRVNLMQHVGIWDHLRPQIFVETRKTISKIAQSFHKADNIVLWNGVKRHLKHHRHISTLVYSSLQVPPHIRRELEFLLLLEELGSEGIPETVLKVCNKTYKW